MLLARTGRPTKRLLKRKVTLAPEVSVPARACAGKRSSRAPSTIRTAAPLASAQLGSDHVARGAHGASEAVLGTRGELQGGNGPGGRFAEPECRYQDSP